MGYASVFTLELRLNHNCYDALTFVRNFDQCFKVRIMFNGHYMDLRHETVFKDSVQGEFPDPNYKVGGENALPIKDGTLDQEYLLENLYDFTAKDLFDLIRDQMYPGDIKERC